MAVMCLILQETPLKISMVNLSFPSSRWKVVEWTPLDWGKNFEFISEFSIKSCWMEPPIWHLGEILEILLFQVQSIDACKFAINLFPISWGPFEDVNLLYFLLKMQIWNGCNVLNITRNPIKDINVNLSFPSSRWKGCGKDPPGDKFLNSFLVQYQKLLNGTPNLTSGGNFGNSTFPGTVHWCMQICHKISWGPFEDVNLLSFLLKMQIWKWL